MCPPGISVFRKEGMKRQQQEEEERGHTQVAPYVRSKTNPGLTPERKLATMNLLEGGLQ